jgi:hypothetical protein
MPFAFSVKNAPVDRSIPLYTDQRETAAGFTSCFLSSDSVPSHRFFNQTSSPLFIIWACPCFATGIAAFLRVMQTWYDKINLLIYSGDPL